MVRTEVLKHHIHIQAVHIIPPVAASYITGGGLESFGNRGVFSLFARTGDRGTAGRRESPRSDSILSVIKL